MISSPSVLDIGVSTGLRSEYAETYDARATSLPEGEIVADPTLRSTEIDTLMSKVLLS